MKNKNHPIPSKPKGVSELTAVRTVLVASMHLAGVDMVDDASTPADTIDKAIIVALSSLEIAPLVAALAAVASSRRRATEAAGVGLAIGLVLGVIRGAYQVKRGLRVRQRTAPLRLSNGSGAR